MPRDLSAELINGSSVVVKWNPPLNENGVLLNYQVTYQGEEVIFCMLIAGTLNFH